MEKGTTAFIPDGINKTAEMANQYRIARAIRRNILKGASPLERQLLDSTSDSRLDFFRRKQAHWEIAQRADYFMKHTTQRLRGIELLLTNAGVNIEKSIQPLTTTIRRDGKPLKRHQLQDLYERGNYYPITPETLYASGSSARRVNHILNQMYDSVARMHSVGVTHNHLHIQNWLINPHGKVELIDLSTARRHRPPHSKQEFLSLFKRDYQATAFTMMMIQVNSPGSPYFNHENNQQSLLVANINRMLEKYRKMGLPTFGVTPEEILNK